jgi:phosphomannomutase / phosphoglucomutase
MGRIFSIIAGISALMVLLAGGGSYWFSATKVRDSETKALAATANGLAASIAAQLETLQLSVDGLAGSPDVIAALSSGDPATINSLTNKVQSLVPGALRIRLLPPTINEPDQAQLPRMGFGDLEMVRSTLTAKQKPVIQGEGEDRHLAFTGVVTQNDKVVGVVLASLKADLVNRAVAKIPFNGGFAEIKQDQIVLAKTGNEAAKIDDPEEITPGNSRWSIHFWTETTNDATDLGLVSTISLIPALLACLAFFMGYRKLAEYLRADQSTILKAAKDMMTGKNVGNYPVQLEEMRPIISTLAQFKRAIDQNEVSPHDQSENKEPDFFDESFDIDFLEDSPPVAADHSTNGMTMASTPISMPNMDGTPVSLPAGFMQNKDKQFANIFRGYDIRGIVGKGLNEEVVANIGRAVASEAKELGIKTIVIARDGRLSSPSLSTALAKGICSAGCDVLDIGLVPTPVLYFVAHHTDGRSGMMITGSHNPADYNGLKIVLNDETLAGDRIQAIKRRIEAGDYSQGETGSIEQNNLFVNEYIGIISEDIHIVRPMTVVVDCGNGAAGQLGPILLKTLGCEVIGLYCDIDGTFPNHHPDPSKPENLADLAAVVKQHGADVGIAFDGDGDRLGIVDSKGKIIWPDRQLMLFAGDVLSRKLGAEIIYDVKCSKHLHNQIIKLGGHPVMWKSGHSLMKAKIKETGATLAGEMSGHIFFNDRWFGFDDALYAAARMIEILSADSRTSAEVFAELPDNLNTPELNVPLEEGENVRFIEQMFNLANFSGGNIINIDGMRVEFADGWGLVRASNTTPSLTLRFEADNREAMGRIQAQFRSLMLQVKPHLSLPF